MEAMGRQMQEKSTQMHQQAMKVKSGDSSTTIDMAAMAQHMEQMQQHIEQMEQHMGHSDMQMQQVESTMQQMDSSMGGGMNRRPGHM
jgi:hypothetical protein